MRLTREKIQSVQALHRILKGRRASGRRVVFTNGCFDLLHVGHVRYLEKARAAGDLLVVALNSDRSVNRLKGRGRPVIPQQERAEILAALECVDYVVIFDEDTPREMIRRLLPDVLAKGADWPADQIVGRRIVESHGGRILSIDFEEGNSSSEILDRIRSI